MRVREPKHGQIGDHWLSKKPGRSRTHDPWCRTWYDKQKRQTCRESLGTYDFREASRLLAEWVVRNSLPENGRPEDVLVDQVLLAYWKDYAQFLPAATTQEKCLKKWQKFWEGKYVSEITVASQKAFRAEMGEGRLAPSSIDRMLSVGRAALHRAVAQEQLLRAPKIVMTEKEDDRASRPEMGRPISVNEMAVLFKTATDPLLFIFMLLLTNTLSRPGALYDLQRKQFDAEHNLLALNPPGRKQTKKHRPVISVTATLRPWLEVPTDPEEYYLQRQGGGRLRSLDSRWDRLRAKTGLHDLTAYSFRHGMSRELRKRRVPLEEIKLILGHKPMGSDKTTEIYAPFDPDYCTNAKAAIDTIMCEVIERANLVKLDSPSDFLTALAEREREAPTFGGSAWAGLSATQQVELREAMIAGKQIIELQSEFGISTTTITKYRKKFGFGDARKRKPS